MPTFLPTIILRHRKENLRKCSLKGLENRSDFVFYTYPVDTVRSLDSYILLDMNGPTLTNEDKDKGLFLIDGTWAHAKVMAKQYQWLEKRSLPKQSTAYPRRQTKCENPDLGLASIEAIFFAYRILGRSTEGLLDHYYWKESLYKKNKIDL